MSSQHKRTIQSYKTVLATVKKERDTLAKSLKSLQNMEIFENQKKTTLKNYQQEYYAQIQQTTQVNVGDITRYRAFVHQLEQLINEQEYKIAALDTQKSDLVAQISQKQKKINVLEDLIHEKQRELDVFLDKKQQVMIDDMAGRKATSQRMFL